MLKNTHSVEFICVSYFQENPFEYTSMSDLTLRLQININQLQPCIEQMIQVSIIEKVTVGGIQKYRYLQPCDQFLFQMKRGNQDEPHTIKSTYEGN